MKTFVIGSKELSCIVLETLIQHGHEVLGVFSRDHEPGMKVWLEDLGHRSLAKTAEDHKIPVYFDQKVNDPSTIEFLGSLELDVIFSCFWSELFKAEILGVPRLGVYNLHTALLPFNRGSRPIPWAILKREQETGITLHKMRTGVDNGPIVDQEAIAIGVDDTAATVYERLTHAGQVLIERSLPRFGDSISMTEQDESLATYQLRGEPYGGQIQQDWNEVQIDRFKRAMTFPPFKSWRESPQKVNRAGVRVILMGKSGKEYAKEGTTAEIREVEAVLPYQTQLTGGSVQDRKDLRAWAGQIDEKVVMLDKALDLEQYYPVLECLLRRKARCAVIGYSTQTLNLMRTPQPYRHKNGLLEIPMFDARHVSEAIEWLIGTVSSLHPKDEAVYLGIRLSDHLMDEAAQGISKEKLLAEAHFVGIEEVCKEYNTPYEDLSS